LIKNNFGKKMIVLTNKAESKSFGSKFNFFLLFYFYFIYLSFFVSSFSKDGKEFLFTVNVMVLLAILCQLIE